jgi:hypothetical protein
MIEQGSAGKPQEPFYRQDRFGPTPSYYSGLWRNVSPREPSFELRPTRQRPLPPSPPDLGGFA